MKKIKMITAVMMCMLLVMGMTACGNTNTNAPTETSDTRQTEAESNESTGSHETNLSDVDTNTESADVMENEEPETDVQTAYGKDTLVVVFSATGTTKGVAERIAAAENADFYEILAAETYTSDDLNYNDSNSRTTKEQDDKSVRPEIASESIDLSGYSKIYIGYPIWWGEEPRIMDTFSEEVWLPVFYDVWGNHLDVSLQR